MLNCLALSGLSDEVFDVIDSFKLLSLSIVLPVLSVNTSSAKTCSFSDCLRLQTTQRRDIMIITRSPTTPMNIHSMVLKLNPESTEDFPGTTVLLGLTIGRGMGEGPGSTGSTSGIGVGLGFSGDTQRFH
jgi:hypothetical protein